MASVADTEEEDGPRNVNSGDVPPRSEPQLVEMDSVQKNKDVVKEKMGKCTFQKNNPAFCSTSQIN